MEIPEPHQHLKHLEQKMDSLTQTIPDIKTLIEQLLISIGENPTREGLEKTPARVEKAFQFMTKGYHEDVDEVLNGALFSIDYDEMVIVKDIDFYSMCEHHLLPFFGKCHIAYIPAGKIIGLSKIPRLVEVFSRRLQVQERLTVQIAEALEARLQPQGVAVVVEGFHLCMMMRGIQKQNAYTTTSSMLGAFRNQQKTREEFLQLLRHNVRRNVGE